MVTPAGAMWGAWGGVGHALAAVFLARGGSVDLVTRAARHTELETRFKDAIAEGHVRVIPVAGSYVEFAAERPYRAYVFAQALFEPKLLVEMSDERLTEEVSVGLTDPMRLTRALLKAHPPGAEERRDFAFIGSTSAYAGFKATTIYCAVKHGLLGFVRALNDEYAETETRFWLFSTGTMNTEMGARLAEQEPTSFLQPEDVARRIVESLASPGNLFEPEMLMRRRKIRFRKK
jgi:NAD(P)-dependent dehydrogenase (short-subunit alcohol dehydrogenase family)